MKGEELYQEILSVSKRIVQHGTSGQIALAIIELIAGTEEEWHDGHYFLKRHPNYTWMIEIAVKRGILLVDETPEGNKSYYPINEEAQQLLCKIIQINKAV